MWLRLKRAIKEIGSSLEADIILNLKKEKFELLKDINLPEYFITSKAEKKLVEKNETIVVKKSTGNKCERCWKILEKKCSRTNCPII